MLNDKETNGIHVLHIELHYIASPSWYYRDQVKLQHSSGNQRQMVLPGWTRLHAASEEEKYGVQTKRTEDYPIQMSGGQRTDVHAKVTLFWEVDRQSLHLHVHFSRENKVNFRLLLNDWFSQNSLE